MKLCVRLEGGREHTAPVEEWVAAIIGTMTATQRVALLERMAKGTIGYSTPGSHILRAEPGSFTGLFRG